MDRLAKLVILCKLLLRSEVDIATPAYLSFFRVGQSRFFWQQSRVKYSIFIKISPYPLRNTRIPS